MSQADAGPPRVRRYRAVRAGWLAAVIAATVAGCATGPEVAVRDPNPGIGFAGVVAADEPRAVVVGRQVLADNGTAADAAVAMSFAMTATLPSRVGLGGGGACLIHRAGDNQQDALLFLPGVSPGGAAVPALARGMAALHARHGALQWPRLVRPAERFAAFGHEISRAYRQDLARGKDRLSAPARGLFLADGGRVPKVGQKVRYRPLGEALAGVRERGAGYFTTGAFPQRVADGAQAAGHRLTPADIRDQVPAFADPIAVAFDPQRLLLPPAPVSAGPRAAAAWRTLADTDLGDMPAGMRIQRQLAALREGAPNGAADRQAMGAEPSAGFAVADRAGNMVACGLTMNGLFGSGDLAGDTGILLAAPRPPEVAGRALLPALAIDPDQRLGIMAMTAGSDHAAAPVLIQLLSEIKASRDAAGLFGFTLFGGGDTGGLNLDRQVAGDTADLADGRDLPEAGRLLLGPRVAPVPGMRVVQVEQRIDEAIRAELRAAGYGLHTMPAVGNITLVRCPEGAPVAPQSCSAAADPRGHGMAVRAE